LRQRLPLLAGGLRDLPVRQRTLRDTIQWSYDLLGSDEQRVVRHLSTFVGGWTTNAAAAVVGDEETVVLKNFRQLSDHSLIERQSTRAATSRHGMLEVIREFGLERLRECGEMSEAQRRHAAHFLRFAACVEEMVLGAISSIPLDQIDADFANLRAALDWFVEEGDAESALLIASGLQWYWVRRGSLTEAQSWLDTALAMDGSMRGDVRAAALNTAGIVAAYQGDAARSSRQHTDALRWFEAEGGQYGIAFSLHGLARAAQVAGDLPQACALNERSLLIFRQLDAWIGIAGAAINLAGSLQVVTGGKRPKELALEALSIADEHGDAAFQTICLNFLAQRALTENDVTRADELASHSLTLNRRMQTSRHSITGLEIKAALALHLQHLNPAVILFGAAARMRQRIGFPAGERWRYRYDVESLQRTLGDDSFHTAWSAGERMSVGEAIDFALTHTL
jgi:tetratricopeptide (TPR) repeat protein